MALLLRAATILFILATAPAFARDAGAFRIAVPALLQELDPHKAAGAVDLAVASELFTGLVARDADGALIPGAAQWEISLDGLTYTFRLRAGQTWSDGVTVEAADFAAGLTRALDPATAAPFAAELFPILGAAEFNARQQPAALLGLAVLDAQTLIITLARPSARFLSTLSRPVAAPVPRHAPQGFAGNGAFIPETDEEGLTLVRNPRFSPAAQSGRIAFVTAASADDALALTREGGAEMSLGFGFEGFAGRLNPRGLRAQAGQNLLFVMVNLRHELLAKREARHALGMAIDREGMVKAQRFAATPAYTFVPPALYGETLGERSAYAPLPNEMRVAIAEVLLAEFKVSPKQPASLRLLHSRGGAQAAIAKNLAAAWARMGVQARLEEKSAADYDQALRNGDFDLALGTWPAPDADPAGFMAPLSRAGGPWNAGAYADTDFEQRLADADADMDPAHRPVSYTVAETFLLQDQAVLPVFFYTPLRAVATGVEGWQPNAPGIHPLRLLSK